MSSEGDDIHADKHVYEEDDDAVKSDAGDATEGINNPPDPDGDEDGEAEGDQSRDDIEAEARDHDEEVDEGDEGGPDDDDDDEDEEDEEVGRHRKKPRRERRNQFLDVEAEVDEDEEDMEEDEEGLMREDGFIQEAGAEGDEPEDDTDDRLHRQVDSRREALAEEDAERLASEYREKYGRSTASKYRADTGVVPQRLLLPSVYDPNIWGVRCKPGKEKELVRLILKKKINLQYTKQPLEIFSCFQRDTFTGYIYVEARKQAAVEQALNGFPNVYPRNMVLVPIKEYPDMFRVNKSKETELLPGAYVRVKRGKYSGDLAIVENLSENGLEARLKLVPRLDYGRSAVLDSSLPIGPDGKRKRPQASSKVRPPPKLFSVNDAMQYDPRNVQRRGGSVYIYGGEEYENGYLLKDFKISYLVTEGINPRLEELTRFNNASEEGIDLAAVSESLKQAAAAVVFQAGEDVQVHSGEQSGLNGRVVATSGTIVTIVGTDGVLKDQKMDIPAANLRKRFSVGDHVRVMNGNYKDETGMVVRVYKDTVIFLSDLSRTEVTVFAKDLRAASDIGGKNSLGNFELHDLVQLNSQTVGCIVSVERDKVGILGQDGLFKELLPSSITMKLTSGRQFATDRNGREIRVGDTVKETSGEYRQGAILHIHHGVLFLHNRDISENLGVFVSRLGNVATVADKGGNSVGSGSGSESRNNDLNRMNPNVQRPMGGGDPMGPPQGGRRFAGNDRIHGLRVAIGRGSQYKGMIGRVKDTTDAVARIELEAKNKVVNVDKVKLLFFDKSGHSTIPYDQFVRSRGGGGAPGGPGGPVGGRERGAGGFGGRTPAWNAGGPAGGRTPAWAGAGAGGGRTPAWNANGGGRTPAWNAAGGRTPAWAGSSGGGAGGRTPAWNSAGAGAATPAWNAGGAGGRTPAWNAGSATPAWNAGGRTPAFGGGRTPAWDVNKSSSSGASSVPVEAPTPGSFYGSSEFTNAPTPGFTPGNMGAPTPGPYREEDISAPTPGVFEAKTPAAAAATPGAWEAESPKYEPATP